MKYTTCVEGDQTILYPYGENPQGILIYTLHEVSVHIMTANRTLKGNLLEEQIERAVNYGGYVGTYEIKGNTVIHYPKISSVINFLQSPQIRHFTLQDHVLIIQYSFFSEAHGRKAQSQLIWQRTIQIDDKAHKSSIH